MARIVILGAGACGLAAGLMLARDGHEITIFERDEAPVPESAEQAWEAWSRDGVTQFRQAHFLPSGGRLVLEETLPDVLAALVSAGATRFDALGQTPPSLAGKVPSPSDERFVTFTARRPVIEQVLAQAADREPGIDLRRGVEVQGLTMVPSGGTPRVTGVRAVSQELPADLVVDAMGRRSPLPRWLRDAHVGSLYEESEDSGFIYYTRYFQSAGGGTPQPRVPLLAAIGTFSILTIPADNDTWSMTMYVSSGDQALKRMRETDRWTAVVRACPLHAHWLEGEPITDVMAMGGVVDRYRRPVVDGRPLLTGIALLADACACTNPSLGRGITLGLMHARSLREVVGAHLDDPLEFAEAWDAITEATLTPWYRETVAEDRGRLREIEALRSDAQPAQSDEPPLGARDALMAAVPHDPGLFVSFLESRCCLVPLSEALDRPGVSERVLELAAEHGRIPIPGPGREELLRLLA